MSWHLDTPVRIGPAIFAAISDSDVVAHPFGRVISATCRKQPVLILSLQADEVKGIGLDGKSYGAPDIESRFPGAIKRLRDVIANRKGPAGGENS